MEFDRWRVAASYSRFSSELQDAKSISQQQRRCRERAHQEGLELPAHLEFSDEAVSGAMVRRSGIDALLAAAQNGEFGTLFVFDLSRLARESLLTGSVLKTLVHIYKVRVVSVSDGVDSDREGWFTLAMILGLQNEQYLKTLSANVLRGLVENILDGLSVGDYSFGYSSVPIAESNPGQRRRNARPKRNYVIDDDEAAWVIKVFQWFVVERRSLQWIVRQLNRLKAPTDHRNRYKKWGRNGVIALLRRTKYIGIWPWGELRNSRNPLTGKITQELRPEEETECWVRHFPELQIIDLETFEAAQKMLDENVEKCAAYRTKQGQLRGSAKDSAEPRHLLQGLIQCAGCGAKFYVGGSNGQYLICPGFRNGPCTLKTMLPRALTEKLILEKVAERILSDAPWRQAVHDCALGAWKKFESTVPTELVALDRQLSDVEQKISRLLNQIEEGLDDPDVARRLKERRAEKHDIAKQVERLRKAAENRQPEPTAEFIDGQLRKLHETLSGSTPAAAVALGQLIGQVIVHEVQRYGRKRPLLRGTFSVPVSRAVKAILSREPDDSASDISEEIVIDFAEPDPKVAQSEEVKKLYDVELANWEIAEKLGLHRSRVTLLWKFWFESRGLPVPDRKSRGRRKPRTTPRYQAIADEAVQLWKENHSESEIGRHFETTQATVRKAIEWWHAERKLPIPKFKDRRQVRMEQAAALYQAGRTLKEISKKLECCVTTVSKMLDEWYAARGETRPDGRSKRRRDGNQRRKKSA